MAPCPLTTTISSEIPFGPPSPGDVLMLPALPSTPPPAPAAGKSKGGRSSQHNLPGDVDLSVFDVLNTFHRRWFLSRTHLVANAISAQKAEDGKISWVEFSPPFHSHLVKCAVALVPRPVPKVKRVMFVYILELLNREGNEAFFELQKGGRKANNAQKEKRHLAWKWSCAAKQEREREAAKAAKLPPCERECLTCGHKFQSCKTVKKHKCSKDSKVVRGKEAAVVPSGLHPALTTKLIKPVAPITPPAPTAPSHSNAVPPVTGDLGARSNLFPSLLQPPITPAQLERMQSHNIRFLMDKMKSGGEIPRNHYAEFQVWWKFLRDGLVSAIEGEKEEREQKRRRQ
jgi:hypothetical protein